MGQRGENYCTNRRNIREKGMRKGMAGGRFKACKLLIDLSKAVCIKCD